MGEYFAYSCSQGGQPTSLKVSLSHNLLFSIHMEPGQKGIQKKSFSDIPTVPQDPLWYGICFHPCRMFHLSELLNQQCILIYHKCLFCTSNTVLDRQMNVLSLWYFHSIGEHFNTQMPAPRLSNSASVKCVLGFKKRPVTTELFITFWCAENCWPQRHH